MRRLRLLFDLPVYALGGWVVWQAIRGYWTSEFLGVDFLVNTALLLFAYLFAIRFLCRRALGLEAKRLLDRAIERTRAAMDGAFEDESVASAAGTETVVAKGVREVQGALERLASLEARWRTELEADAGASRARARRRQSV